MRIAIIAPGSRGDVQPYIALGKGLKKAGYIVRLVTHQNFEELVNSYGLEFWSIGGNVQDIAQSKEMSERIGKGNFLSVISQMAKEAQRGALIMAEGGLAACKGMDLILSGIGGLFIGYSIAEKLDIPFLQAYYIPFTPTKAYPSFLFSKLPFKLGGIINRFSYSIVRQMMWQGFRSADKLARQKVLDLPPAPIGGPYKTDRFNQLPILNGFSPNVIPKPPDWDNNNHITGYWFLDSATNWTPPSDLTEFIQDGPPPVYVGFGSMSSRDPEETTNLVLQALAKTKQRAIILSGWGGLYKKTLPDTVFMIDSAPFSWLFPRMAAVIHHGGAGTTAAGLRAGVPSIVIPFFGDQFFWGQRIAKLGAGPEPIPRKELTVDRLSKAIQEAITDQTIHKKAKDLGLKIQEEDGIKNAVSVIKSIEKQFF
ncbi:MAG: glycosyltransferase [Actinobacteria bacterium]|nr:glycosyltransferase [Actinomycetota bacterium]